MRWIRRVQEGERLDQALLSYRVCYLPNRHEFFCFVACCIPFTQQRAWFCGCGFANCWPVHGWSAVLDSTQDD